MLFYSKSSVSSVPADVISTLPDFHPINAQIAIIPIAVPNKPAITSPKQI